MQRYYFVLLSMRVFCVKNTPLPPTHTYTPEYTHPGIWGKIADGFAGFDISRAHNVMFVTWICLHIE